MNQVSVQYELLDVLKMDAPHDALPGDCISRSIWICGLDGAIVRLRQESSWTYLLHFCPDLLVDQQNIDVDA